VRPNGPQPKDGGSELARALAQDWAGPAGVDELAVDDQQRIVACDPVVAGRTTASWVGADAWATIEEALRTNPAAWCPVEVSTDGPVLCLEGSVSSLEGDPLAVRAYVADDVVGPDGRLGYRVFLASRPTAT
jgi:hypothetical protein